MISVYDIRDLIQGVKNDMEVLKDSNLLFTYFAKDSGLKDFLTWAVQSISIQNGTKVLNHHPFTPVYEELLINPISMPGYETNIRARIKVFLEHLQLIPLRPDFTYSFMIVDNLLIVGAELIRTGTEL